MPREGCHSPGDHGYETKERTMKRTFYGLASIGMYITLLNLLDSDLPGLGFGIGAFVIGTLIGSFTDTR